MINFKLRRILFSIQWPCKLESLMSDKINVSFVIISDTIFQVNLRSKSSKTTISFEQFKLIPCETENLQVPLP